MKPKRIVITATGGHLTTALAVIEELRRRGGWEIAWVGSSWAFEEVTGVPSFESKILARMGIPFWDIQSGKIHRGKLGRTLLSLPRLPVGVGQALAILWRLRPSLVLSLGGYISVPVALAAWILGIPVVVHEQTTTSGLANRIVARLARKVAISHRSSAADFPKDKVVLVGNPLRRAILAVKKRNVRPPVIYITGGSRGSQVINAAVFGILAELVRLARVYHQTGELDLAGAREAKKTLGYLGRSYIFRVNFTPPEVAKIYEKATLVIARAGANTVAELEFLGTPAILVPLPWAEKNEQMRNAKLLESAGTALILPQAELSPKALLASVKQVLAQPRKFRKKKRGYLLARPLAARRLANLLYEVL